MGEGTVNRSTCSLERTVTLQNRLCRRARVKVAAILVAMRLAAAALKNTARAHRSMRAPQRSSCRRSPVGAISSMMCSRIQGKNSSSRVEPNLIPTCRAVRTAWGRRKARTRFIAPPPPGSACARTRRRPGGCPCP